MKSIFASLFLLALAACSSGAPPKVVEAGGEGIAATRPNIASLPREGARRAIATPNGPLVADYLLVDKSDRLLIAYRAGEPIRAYRGIQFGDQPSGHKQFQGDERTPEGRYTIDWRNPQSRFHLSLRISYPNADDRAHAAR